MKQALIVILIVCNVLHSKAAELRSIQMGSTRLYYYFSRSVIPKQTGLIVFMHGAVSQYMNKTNSDSIPLANLLENNDAFLPACSNAGYDVIIPIAHNTFNWLDMQGKTFVDTLFGIYKNNYPKTILSGFSDGGTGAYKYFYTTPERYDGVMIFNGYPQHKKFYKTVDYLKVTYKKVIFFSQDNDKVIPYEFLLREYRRQKMVNGETYFFLTKGHHRFNEYIKNDFEAGLWLLKKETFKQKTNSDSILVYPSIDGLLYDKIIVALYEFRQAEVKKYGMSKREYIRTDYNPGTLKKMLKKTQIAIHPTAIKKEELMNNDTIEFTYEYLGTQFKIKLNNYLRMKEF